MEFSRTKAAANADKRSRWDLVAAIAEDAIDAGVPITSTASVTAAKEALDAVGLEMTPDSVKNLSCLAKFDHESTDRQRQEWRRYGTSVVREVALAGWSQEAAFDLLARPKRVTRSEVRIALKAGNAGVTQHGAAPDINEQGHRLLSQINAWFTDMAKFADRAEAEGGLDSYSAAVLETYHALTEKRIDAELRQILEAEAAR